MDRGVKNGSIVAVGFIAVPCEKFMIIGVDPNRNVRTRLPVVVGFQRQKKFYKYSSSSILYLYLYCMVNHAGMHTSDETEARQGPTTQKVILVSV